MKLMAVVSVVFLVLSVVAMVSAEGYIRAQGLYRNRFTAQLPPGESQATSQASTTVSTTQIGQFQHAVLSTRSNNIVIFVNGYLNLAGNPTLVQPSTVPTTGTPTPVYDIATPFMVPTGVFTVEYSYRTFSCLSLAGFEYNTYDCNRAKSDLQEQQQQNPREDTFIINGMMIVTWRFVQGAAEFYTQAILVTVNERINNNAINNRALRTYMIFAYQGQLPTGVTGQYPVIGSFVNNLNSGFTLCENGSPISRLNRDYTFLVTNSNNRCGKQGIIQFNNVAASLPQGGPSQVCLETILPQDACAESIICTSSTNNLGQTTYTVTLTFNFLTSYNFVHVNPNDFSNDLSAGCLRNELDRTDGNGNLITTHTFAFSLDSTNQCGVTVDQNTGQISGRFRLLKENMRAQHGDFEGVFSCMVNDFAGGLSTSFTVGPIPDISVVKTGRSLQLDVVDRFPTTSGNIYGRMCKLGERLSLRLTYNVGTPFNAAVDPIGAYGINCQFSNTDSFIPGTSGSAVDENGIVNNFQSVTTQVETVIADGCAAKNPTDVFYINPTPNANQDLGFTAITATPTLANTATVMQTGLFKCASFEGTQRVSIRCEVQLCFNGVTGNGAASRCRDSCLVSNTDRRRRSTDHVDVLYTNFTVIGDSRPNSSDVQGGKSSGISRGSSASCVDNSTAIGTLAGLIIGLLLASGITIGAFVRLFVRNRKLEA